MLTQVQSSRFPQNAVKAQFSTRLNAICVEKNNNSNDFMLAKICRAKTVGTEVKRPKAVRQCEANESNCYFTRSLRK